MTFDLKLQTLCDHRVSREEYFVDPGDLTTLRSKKFPEMRIERPIANPKVELRRNGWIIPQSHPKFGYTLPYDPNSVEPNRRKMLLFNIPVKSLTDEYELSYYTFAANCRKCNGLRIVDDITFGGTGKVNKVEQEDKLIQDLLKIVITSLKSNPFYEWYGTSLVSLIGSKIVNSTQLETRITKEVTTAILNLKQMQKNQIAYQDKKIDPRELILRPIAVSTRQNPNDPTYFEVRAVVQTVAGNTVEFERRMRIPGPDNKNFLFSTQGIGVGSQTLNVSVGDGTPLLDF